MNNEDKPKKEKLKVVDIASKQIKDASKEIFEDIKGKKYMVIVMGETELDIQTVYFNGEVTMMDVIFHCGLASRMQYDGLLAIQEGEYE